MDKQAHINEQMVDFLSVGIQAALDHINMEKVYELRLRSGKPLYINYAGRYCLLGKFGLTDLVENAYIVQQDEVEDAVYQAGEYSVYSIEEQIRDGYITTRKGVRIGLAGRFVFEKGQPLTIRDISSLCIRIPHDIKGASEEIYRRCLSNGQAKNILLMSLPGRGKTTALRALSRLIGERTGKNILVCDERGELTFGALGVTCDVLSFADKRTAFEVGIRTLRPDYIVTDELAEWDIPAVKRAISSGVQVLATAHLGEAEDGKQRYADLFDRYVLFEKDRIGQVDKIFDANWKELP